jgi:hypothetical protein
MPYRVGSYALTLNAITERPTGTYFRSATLSLPFVVTNACPPRLSLDAPAAAAVAFSSNFSLTAFDSAYCLSSETLMSISAGQSIIRPRRRVLLVR